MTTDARTTVADGAPETATGPLVPGDLLRLAAAVSLVVATASFGWLAFALFFLVLGGTFLPRGLGTSGPVDAAYCTAILFGAWAAQLDWYAAVPGLDLGVHAVATGLVAVVAGETLVRLGALPAVDDPRPARPALGVAVSTIAIGIALAVVWEVGEWFGHAVVDHRIQVGYADTLSDLVAGACGALVAGVVASRSLRRPA